MCTTVRLDRTSQSPDTAFTVDRSDGMVSELPEIGVTGVNE